MQTDAFKQLSKSALVSLISNFNLSVVKQSSVYNAILSWTQEDESRKVDFTELFHLIKLPSLSIEFFDEVVSKEPLVKGSTVCLSALTSGVIAKFKVDLPKVYKILCVNGIGEHLVFNVYSGTGNISKANASVPNKPENHCLLKLDDFVYCIGGYPTKLSTGTTNKVYCLDLSESNLRWKEVASMSESRSDFGAVVCNGCLVVNGSGVHFKTTEVYRPELNRWTNIAPTNRPRRYHQLVTVGGTLFAIGGHDNNGRSSMERLDDMKGQWRMVQSMNTPRYSFAAVACQGYFYAIGGYSTVREKTVEKYDPGNNTWIYVSSMNIERTQHAACVLQGKIYVIGGHNASGQVVKTIEFYDPELDQWTIVEKTEHKCLEHGVVAL